MAKGKSTTRVVTKRKKNNQEAKKINNVSTLDGNIKGVVFIVIGVLVFFALFYLLTLFLLHRNAEKEKTEATISYSEILAGRSFSMSDSEYLVLFYDTSADDAYLYSDLLSKYEDKEEHLPIYYVDLGNAFNSVYTTEEEANTSPQSVSDLQVHGATLMKISDKQVSDYIEGETSITEYLS